METRYLYLNGEVMPESQAAISPYDIGLLRGYAVFDLLRTAGGRPFLLAEHLRRLRASADALGLAVPASDEDITSAITSLLARNGDDESTVRLLLTGGISPDGLSFDPSTPTFVILTLPLHLPPDSVYEEGTILLTQEHRREAPEAKSTNYVTMLRHRGRTLEAGALDLLYHDGGTVSEAASASFYIVRDGRIHAPADGVLWGTVGSWLLDAVADRHETVYGPFTLEQTLAAAEAFLTSTTRGVVPIVGLDDSRIADGTPGPVTRELMAVWDDALKAAAGR